MNYAAPNDAFLPVALIFALAAAILAVVAEQTRFFPRAVQWLRKDPVVRTALVALLLAIGPITARTKNGQMSTTRPPMMLEVTELPQEPPFALVEIRTNAVSVLNASTNAVVSETCLRCGTSEGGEWVETATPFFSWRTNDIRRLYASPGCLSFGTIIRMLPRRLYAKLGFAPAAGEYDVAFEQAEKKHSSEGHSLHA